MTAEVYTYKLRCMFIENIFSVSETSFYVHQRWNVKIQYLLVLGFYYSETKCVYASWKVIISCLLPCRAWNKSCFQTKLRRHRSQKKKTLFYIASTQTQKLYSGKIKAILKENASPHVSRQCVFQILGSYLVFNYKTFCFSLFLYWNLYTIKDSRYPI